MRKMRRNIKLIVGIIALCMCAISYFNKGLVQPSDKIYEYGENGLRVHFVDVGQADCTLIELPDGQTMLIDAGNNDDGENVVSYIEEQGIDRLDIVVGTHPHEDHIGGLDDVIDSFDIGEIYMPKVQANTKTFRDVLSSVKEKNLSVKTAKAGVNIISEEDLSIKMVAPVNGEYEELNNYSAVIRLEYGGKAFLFTGDAEMLSEEEITENIQSDVLKVGHHGSSTSTGEDFLRRVNPDYAYIPCGNDNSYGHPHRETMAVLNSAGIEIYRADEDGTVIFETDGKSLRVVN